MATRTSGMRAGRLRHRIKLQAPKVEVDPNTGEPIIVAWLDVATVWASIEALSGREWLASDQYRPGVTTRIRIRWRDGVTSSMRALHKETVYSIDAVIPNFEGMAEMQLMCGDGIVTQGGVA
ncbi:phage head closure protein [Paraburkholderia sp. EG287A]|uniref:phage head closure protein n=1 Tax=unclassified Paraburkholderia TaxID=2615204 RepID=UPI0034D1EF31